MGPTRRITSVKVRDSSLAGTDINEATLANNHGANGSLAFGSLGVRVGRLHRAGVSTFSASGGPAERPFFLMVPRGPG